MEESELSPQNTDREVKTHKSVISWTCEVKERQNAEFNSNAVHEEQDNYTPLIEPQVRIT